MFGRRPDGRRINKIDPVMKITPYVMPMRCDAQVFLKHRADLEAMSRFIRRQGDQEFVVRLGTHRVQRGKQADQAHRDRGKDQLEHGSNRLDIHFASFCHIVPSSPSMC